MTSAVAAKRPRKSFYIIALILPIVLLLLSEMLLRLLGAWHSYPLFIAAPQMEGYLQPNPQVIYRYFATPAQAPNVSPDTQYFLAQKPATTFRVVMQGGSTAAGFPYGRFGSPGAMLQQRLKRLYPDRDIEIINTAMSAVNSYTLLDFADEIAAIQPDLVLIYAGHNEFLGVMGVGSNYAATGSAGLLYLKLKSLALFQLLQKLWATVSAQTAPNTSDQHTMMAKIAAEKNIPLHSELYQAGIAQFQQNMHLLLQRYQQHGIEVVLSNIASNEADQPPFASSAEPLTLTGTVAQQVEQLEHALQQQPDVAAWHYQLAHLQLATAHYEAALQHFNLAREHDLLRFRAPLAINEVLSKLATEFALPLVDSVQLLRQDSPHQLIGRHVMLEHLHPNARGYFLIAEAFLPEVQALLGPAQSSYSQQQAWQDIPLTDVDLWLAQAKIRQLMSDYPFRQHPQPFSFGDIQSPLQQFAFDRFNGESWLDAQQKLLQFYQQQKQPLAAAKVAANLFDALPTQHQAAYIAGQLYFSAQDPAMAAYYQQRAVLLQPNKVQYRLMYARSLYLQQRYPAALNQLDIILQHEPANAIALRQKSQLQRMIKE